jgi:hypothetical protein
MRRARRIAAALTVPVAATALALGFDVPAAAAASGAHTETFTYTSLRTQEDVSCTIAGSLSSTPRTGGGWDLRAYVRITDASSNECFDGIAHLAASHDSAPDDNYFGGGSVVQANSVTPSEVTRISYEIYFNGCGCYSPEYRAPK